MAAEMNSSVTVILFGFLLTLWTCSDQSEELFSKEGAEGDSVTSYTIPAGAHYCLQSSYQPMGVSALKFTARFDSSAIYQTADGNNQGDINKLYGISDCGTTHQINSARFGWRWFENELQIWAYTYANSERTMQFVKSVPINTTHTYEIVFTDSSYQFKLDDVQVSLPRHCTGHVTGYKLFPYFGGDEAAPHDVTIHIKDIE